MSQNESTNTPADDAERVRFLSLSGLSFRDADERCDLADSYEEARKAPGFYDPEQQPQPFS